MLTIFTMPKAFSGHTGIIQKNAIRSWQQLRPACDIILLGDDEGTAATAVELGVRHAPEIERSEYGTPLISSIYNNGQRLAKYDTVCHINADIMLMSDFLKAIRRIPEERFLMVGQRWDLDVTEPVDFTSPGYEEKLRDFLARSGRLHNKSGIDYFVFPRGLFGDIPAFAIGRAVWDNWLIYRSRALKVPVIDATQAVTVIHQNHDYSHIKQKNGSPPPAGVMADPKAPERARNLALANKGLDCLSLEYVTHTLGREGLKKALTPRHLYFRLRAIPILHTAWRPWLRLFQAFEKCVSAFRSSAS